MGKRAILVRNCILVVLLCTALFCAFLPFAFAKAESEHHSAHTTKITAGGGTLVSGSYYLDGNVTLSNNLVIAEGAQVHLCLNGHVLRGNGKGSVITVKGALHLYDCNTETVNNITYTVNGQSKSTTVYGGAIVGGSFSYGGGIEVGSYVFYMYGGTIIGNNATGAEGGATNYGGGVNISNNGKMYMYGGEITDNYAYGYGGGVAVGGMSGSEFYLYGGTITGNQASISGGGVYVGDNSSTILLGSENEEDAGVITVTGNKVGNNDNNIEQNPDGFIEIPGKIGEGSQIGLTLPSGDSAFGRGYGDNNDADPNDIFSFDGDPDKVFEIEEGTGNIIAADTLRIDIPSSTAWQIVQSGASVGSLDNGPVYEYVESGNTVYSVTDPGGATKYTAFNSVAYYTGHEIEIEISTNISAYCSIEYVENTESSVGKHVSRAILTPVGGKNIEFACVYSENENYGIKITIDEDKKSAIIEKTWYILSDRGAFSNEFLDESSANGNTVSYSIVQSYTFGSYDSASVFPIKQPRLKYGYESGATINYALTVKDENNTTVVNTVTFTDANFDDYINYSMPAGMYTLDISVERTAVPSGTSLWWSNAATASEFNSPAYMRTYSFTVESAEMVFNLEKISDQYGYAHYDWCLSDSSDKTQMFDTFENMVSANIPTFVTVERRGEWIKTVYDDLYFNASARSGGLNNYEITYNFARLYNNKYYPASELVNSIQGGANGTYRVYFRVSAPGHTSFGIGDERYECFFTVDVFETVGLPTIENVQFTGAEIKPGVAGTLFDCVYDDDEYISGGEHFITLKLRDSVHYRWEAGITTSGTNDDCARVAFEITPVTNSWLRSPNIVGWEYGSYDPNINYIVAIAAYMDSSETVRLSISTTADGNTPVAGLEDFAVDENGIVTDSIAALIKKLGSGTYYLVAKVSATANYTAPTAQNIEFKISKASNFWDVAPAIVAWAKGGYNAEANVITATPHTGAETLTIVIADSKGNIYYNTADGTDNLKNAPVGSYILSASVAETDSYYGLEYSVPFRVFEKAGLAWWVILLIVLGILLIIFLIVFILIKKGYIQLVTEKMVVAIRTRADTDATIAAIRAGKVAAEAERAAAEARAAQEAAAAAIEAEDAASDEEEAQPEAEEEPEEMYEPEENDIEVPSSEGFQKAFEVSSNEQFTYGKTVLSKLITAPDIVKTRYSELKNYLLGFKKARANMSRARESYYIGRKCFARIAMRGKTLCLYLALNPAEYMEKYNVEDVLNVKLYVDTPCLLRIRSARAVRYAKQLIDELTQSMGAVANERKAEDYAELFRNIEQLEKKRLLSYSGRKQKTNSQNRGK